MALGETVGSDGPSRSTQPIAIPADAAAAFPESRRYRLKNRLLGPPLTSERLATERLGRPTALAVLSSDVISSAAYGPEQTLIPLISLVGVAAFSLLVPITIAIVVVLLFVTLSYLEVVQVYTKAGGAYVVTRENFGHEVAQVAAISLLIDYTLTVAVSVAAGVAALTSVFTVLIPYTTWIAVALVILIAYANLRGVREAGKVFALPTYFFIVNMTILIVMGSIKAIEGTLHAHSIHFAGTVHVGSPGHGLLYGATLFVLLRSFASGGSALTGTEAISNGVSVFRRPEARNARITMIYMSCILGSLVLGVAALASVTHPVPYATGSPTVISQIARFVYGHGPLGEVLFVALQAATMLILTIAANTSFTGFPYLASFAAEDSYLPRRLTKRGHRLVFSSGIIVLTIVSIALLIITKARVDSLIPLYAIGVFTGFTMAGAGMVRYHLREKEAGWRRRTAINGVAAALSLIVDIVIIVTKFTEGAWTITVILPLGFFALLRLHKQYMKEEHELEIEVAEIATTPLPRRLVVVVMIDSLDMAAARAIQYARTLSADEVRGVHFDIDAAATHALEEQWRRLGLSRLPLDVVECPDRRLDRAALELVADAVIDGQTECSVLLPRRGFAAAWRRLLHDRTADKISAVVSQVPGVSATIIPFNLAGPWAAKGRRFATVALALRETERSRGQGDGAQRGRKGGYESPQDIALAERAGTHDDIGSVQVRSKVRVAGRIRSVRVQPRAGTSNLECVIGDASGGMLLVFTGRPRIPGIEPGARLVAEGMVSAWGDSPCILNPYYELISGRGEGEE